MADAPPPPPPATSAASGAAAAAGGDVDGAESKPADGDRPTDAQIIEQENAIR